MGGASRNFAAITKFLPRKLRFFANLSISRKFCAAKIWSYTVPEEKSVAIEVDNRTEEERRVALLYTWHKREGESATYRKLMIALYQQHYHSLIDQLCGMIKSYALVDRMQEESNRSEIRVKIEMDKLHNRFFALNNRLKSELIQKNIPVKTILGLLTLLPIELKLEYDRSVGAKLPEAAKATTIDDLFYQLTPLSTFIDYSLLNYLTSNFGTTQIKADMTSYVKDVQAFMSETTIGDIMPYWPGERISSEGFSELWVKIQANAKTYTLKKLNEFRIKHCATIKLSEVLCSIKSLIPASSFFAVWLVPTAATIDVTKAVDFYKAEQVSMVVLDNKLLYLSDLTDKCITEEGQAEMIIQIGETEHQLKNAEASMEERLISFQRQIQDLQFTIQQGRQEIRIKDERIEELENQARYQKQRHIQEIRGLQEIISRQKQFINDSSAHISQKNKTIARKDELIAAKEKEIHSLQQQLPHLREHSNKDDTNSLDNIRRTKSLDRQSSLSMSIRSKVSNLSANVLPTRTNQPVHTLQLQWSIENKRAPRGMAAHCNAVVCEKVVYFQPTDTKSLYAYNSETDKWNQLPDVKKSNCSMAVVNGIVTAIGGSKLIRGHSSKLYSLIGEDAAMKWTKNLPPMPTKRSEAIALCAYKALIVAGGEGKNGRALPIVEVMNMDTHQWSRATDLPEPLWGASGMVCGDQFYIVGGVNVRPTRSVHRCDIISLLKSCQPAFHGSEQPHSMTWNKMADLPVTGPTCVSLYEQPILIGGEDSNTRSTAIYMYDQTRGEWKIVDNMSTGKNQCLAAVLPDNRLMIVGGWIDTTQDQTASDVIEFAETEILANNGHSV